MSTSRPTYLRLVALPDFDGVLWKPGTEEGAVVDAGDPLPGPELRAEGTNAVFIDVSADLAQRWLPTPYPVASIGRTVRFVSSTGTTFVDDPLRQGDSYEVEAALVQPTAEELRETPASTPLENGRYLRLPEGPEIEDIETLARAWTADADSEFDKAMAIQDRFQDQSEFTYTIDTPLRGGTRSILEFLKVSKAGFCQQFSTAMAVMLRSIDIQARVVVGFAAGTRSLERPGQYSVMTTQAHSWVEVYFPGWGWMPFEPTPNRVNPTVVRYEPPAVPCSGPDCPDTGAGAGAGEVAGGRGAGQQGLLDPRPRVTGPRGAVGGDPGSIGGVPDVGGISARLLLVLGLITAAIVLLLIPPSRALRRRVELRGAAAEPRTMILVTYEQFTERAAGLGLGRGPGETLEEYRRKVMETGYVSNGHLDRLTGLATIAAYAPREPEETQADEAGRAAETAIREIRRAVGPARWLVGLYRRS